MFEPLPPIAAELASPLAAFQCLTSTSFSFAGGAPIEVALTPSLPADVDALQPLISAISVTLYERCYTHRLEDTYARQEPTTTDDPSFAHQLAEANGSRERWDAKWMIQSVGTNGQIFVRKGDLERMAMPGSFISDTLLGLAPQIGGWVRLRAPHEGWGVQPGYYFAFGETLDDLADHLRLVRVYFHCEAERAPALLAALTRSLNRFQVPFQLKAPVSPGLYGRTDAIVLYLGVRYFPIAARIIAGLKERAELAPSVPLFTKKLWPGVGAAADPGTGESFGQNRCRLAAEGIVGAWREQRDDLPARLKAVATRFAAAGLDLSRPWLGAGWVDLFALPAEPHLS